MVQCVEGVEELFLEALFALYELNVIYEKNVNLAVTPFELNGGVLADCIHEFVKECLRGDITDGEMRIVRIDIVLNSPQKVGFAETGITVDKQWVIGLCGCFGNREGSSVSEPVTGTGNEGLNVY